MWRKIGRDTQELLDNDDFGWVESYTKSEWMQRPIADIDKSMERGHVMVVRQTGLDEGWNWDIDSVNRVKIGPSMVDVQGTSEILHTIRIL